ncbi:MAG: hypothetical protein R2747_16980 [Pyrinomonadaceae bacterium]
MREFFGQFKWQFLIFQRNNLIGMIAGVTVFYVAVVYFLKHFGEAEKFVTLLILTDSSMIGFIFIGLSIILEKDQEVLSALFVTPVNLHSFLISRVLTLSALSLVCAFGMVLMVRGTSFNPIHFSVGAFSACVLFSLFGFFVVSYTTEILHFTLRSIPVLMGISLPLLNYFDLTNLGFLKLFPVQGSLYLIANSYGHSGNVGEIVFGYLSLAVWIPLSYWFVFRTFREKLVNT